eukprot:gene10333-11240_t
MLEEDIMDEDSDEEVNRAIKMSLAEERHRQEQFRLNQKEEERERLAFERAIALSLQESRKRSTPLPSPSSSSILLNSYNSNSNSSSKAPAPPIQPLLPNPSASLPIIQPPLIRSQSEQSEAEQLAAAIELSLSEANNKPRSTLYDVDPGLTFNKTETLTIPEHLYQSFHSIRTYLQRTYGVQIKLYKDEHHIPILKIIGKDGEITGIAKHSIQEMITTPTLITKQIDELSKSKIHIFIDQSNISVSSQYIYNPVTSKVDRDIRQRVNPRQLHTIITSGRTVKTRVIFGSKSSSESNGKGVSNNSDHYIWKKWEELQYQVAYTIREPKNKEQFVDDALIAQIGSAILGNESFPDSPQTLVLLTGDGNDNYGRASFFKTVQQALLHKWKVEIWTWSIACSENYKQLQKAYSGTGLFELIYLDDYRDIVTYVYQPQPYDNKNHSNNSSDSNSRKNKPQNQQYQQGSNNSNKDQRRGGDGRSGGDRGDRGGRSDSRGARIPQSRRLPPHPFSLPSSSYDRKPPAEPDIIDLLSSDEEEDEGERFLCPITCNIFFDPVMTKYGHYYERSAISNWIERRAASPTSRQPLSLRDIREVPNSFRQGLHDYKRKQTRK